MRIRDATLDDGSMIADFNARMAQETEGLTLDALKLERGVRAALSDPGKASYFLAEIDGKIAGQLMITHEWSDWRNGDIWWLQSVYVEKEFRRRGLFRELYRFVRDRAAKRGAVGMRLYVDAANTSAQQTYTSLGMLVTNYKVMEEMFAAHGSERR